MDRICHIDLLFPAARDDRREIACLSFQMSAFHIYNPTMPVIQEQIPDFPGAKQTLPITRTGRAFLFFP